MAPHSSVLAWRIPGILPGGAWWAAIYGVAQSWTRLKRLSSNSSSSGRPLFNAASFNKKGNIGQSLWSWNSNTLATWCKELTHWKRPWCWERLKAREEGDDRGWDGWMAPQTWWTWVWENSGVGDGQGGLESCSLWGHKESDTTERLNWTFSVCVCVFHNLVIYFKEQKILILSKSILGSRLLKILTLVLYLITLPKPRSQRFFSYSSKIIQF